MTSFEPQSFTDGLNFGGGSFNTSGFGQSWGQSAFSSSGGGGGIPMDDAPDVGSGFSFGVGEALSLAQFGFGIGQMILGDKVREQQVYNLSLIHI